MVSDIDDAVSRVGFALLHDREGAMCGTVAVARDVTARVEQERMGCQGRDG
jgi:hypothetical protein